MNLSFLKLGERLRNKIFLGVALVALLPFMISGVFALYLINRTHNTDILRAETNLLNQKKVEVKKFVSESSDSLNVIPPTSDIQSIVTVLKPDEKTAGGETVFVAQNGKRYKFLISTSNLDDLLKNTISAYPAFDELYIVDAKNGIETNYWSNSADLMAGHEKFADFSKLPQFQAALSGKSYVGEVNLTLNGPVVEVAAPITRQDGNIIGVLAGQLNLSGLKNTLVGTSLGASGYIYLLDSEGTLLYNSDASKATPNTNLRDVSVVSQFLKSGGAFIDSNQTQYISFWGEDVIAVATSLKITPDHPWLLVVEWPAADANQVIKTLQNQFLLFLVAVLALTILLSVFLANKIAKPISMLQIGAERIATGIFDNPVEIHTKDELEDLGMAFNKMMAGLKQLQQLKDEFVFIAAHELRTPVAAIKGYLSMIMDGEVGKIDETAKEFIKKVMNANQRLIQLVNDLLQVARSEAGRLTIQVAAIDVVEPIKSVLDELKPLADEKAIKVLYEPTTLPKALADSVRLKEVVVNLVGNAIKYMGPSTLRDASGQAVGGTVTISHEVKDNAVITHIKDTGIGMSPEAQRRLFEKFYRVQSDKTREITGTGLGLFIVKQIVEKMEGKIWVESEEGRGSTFSFSLPIAKNVLSSVVRTSETKS
jgi:signal transduction histidine kinase